MAEVRKETIDTLNRHFKTAVVEKYPDAMIQLFIDNAWEAVCGKDYRKKKVSERDRARIKNHILNELRRRYGKWITVVNFDKKFRFSTNFEFVYKTEYGRLYGNPPGTSFDIFFCTSHSLDQFDERVPPEMFKDFSLAFKYKYGTNPTAADIILFFIFYCFQFGIYKNFIYLNINYGILVLEAVEEKIYIAKTFLSKDMIDPYVEWRLLKEDLFLQNVRVFEHFNDLYSISEPLYKPFFEVPQFNYSFFIRVMGGHKL